MLAESDSEEEPIWRSDAQDRDMCRLCTTSKHSVLWSIHLISLLYGHFSSNMSIKYLLVWSTCQLDFPALKLYNKFMYSQLLFALQLPSDAFDARSLLNNVNQSRYKKSEEGAPMNNPQSSCYKKKEYCDRLPLLILLLNFDGSKCHYISRE